QQPILSSAQFIARLCDARVESVSSRHIAMGDGSNAVAGHGGAQDARHPIAGEFRLLFIASDSSALHLLLSHRPSSTLLASAAPVDALCGRVVDRSLVDSRKT